MNLLSSATNTNLHQKQNKTDQILVESTAGELDLGYGVYEADFVTCSIPDESAIPFDGAITNDMLDWLAQSGPTISGGT